MHYYKFNISSWSKDVAHLSLEEEAIYFRLINYYYDTEKPIPLKTQMVFRKLRLATHQETAEMILEEFFEKTKEGWRHHHCDKIIESYQNLAERNRNNGKNGGRPKNKDLGKPSGLNVGNQQETQPVESGNLNQELKNYKLKNEETNNQTPAPDGSVCENDSAKEVLEYLNEISNSKYKASTKSHIQQINARLSDGHTVEDLKLVTKHKVNEWINDPKMVNYIRPATLYQAGKFNGYLLAARANEPKEPVKELSQDEQLEQQRRAFEEGLKYL